MNRKAEVAYLSDKEAADRAKKRADGRAITISQPDISTSSMQISTTGNLTFPDMLAMLAPVINGGAKQCLDAAAEAPGITAEVCTKIKKELYDMMNITFGNILTDFAPEIERLPDITEDAIVRAEFEILKELAEDPSGETTKAKNQQAAEALDKKAAEIQAKMEANRPKLNKQNKQKGE